MVERNEPKIFRCVIEKPDTTTKLKMPKNTMRPPGNVPYIVDNLWEWKRPEGYPNRRYSVFASPQPSLARDSGPKGGTVYSVEFEGKYKLCQVVGYADSKEHPECRSLKKLILNKLGQEWIDSSLSAKKEIGRLWIPCLSKGDVDQLFGKIPLLKEFRDEVYNCIKYWDDVVLIKSGQPIRNEKGELFFEPLKGYWLREMLK